MRGLVLRLRRRAHLTAADGAEDHRGHHVDSAGFQRTEKWRDRAQCFKVTRDGNVRRTGEGEREAVQQLP